MTIEFKEELVGGRLKLSRNKAKIETAKIIFKLIDNNREHLGPWFPWVEKTKVVEDTLKYFYECDKQEEKGEKIEYGIYLNKEYIGSISFFDISEKNKSAEIGYWLAKEHTGKGYMTEAVKILEKEGFENLKFNRIQIKCDEINMTSKKVAENCNYKLEGKIREDHFEESRNEFRNTLLFSKLDSEYENSL